MEEFITYCKKKIKQYPQHKIAIYDLYELCCTEIESEESIEDEIEKAINSIEELVEE